MTDEMNSAERAQAEIEQGRRYREKPIWKTIQNKRLWLAVMCALLFISGLRPSLITRGDDFNYWDPSAPLDNIISTLGICFWAGMLIWLISDWKWQVRLGATLLFLLLPIIALINAPPLDFDLGEVDHLASVSHQGHIYHLEFVEFSGRYYYLYECDSNGTWCHHVLCFPYDEANATEFDRQVAEYFPICATGKPLPTASP